MSYNVLIVDDSQMIRKVIRKVMTITDFAVGDCFEAGDGREALEILEAQWVDLILTDLNMPRMNGLEMIRALKQDEMHRKIPVVLITTEGSEERIREAYALGIQGYIQKPFHPEAIRDILTRIMEESRV